MGGRVRDLHGERLEVRIALVAQLDPVAKLRRTDAAHLGGRLGVMAATDVAADRLCEPLGELARRLRGRRGFAVVRVPVDDETRAEVGRVGGLGERHVAST